MRFPHLRALLALAGGLVLAGAPGARAQTYTLTWSSIANGGGASNGPAGSSLKMVGTVGHPSPGPIAGGPYSLTGGFWNPTVISNVDVPDDRPETPTSFRVYPNVPNPFSAQTTIAFDLPSEQHVRMSVYDLKGQHVRTLLDQVMPAGRHSMTWAGIGDDGRPLPPGVYWIRTQMNHHSDVRKAVLVN